jgi:eukaryotic-like serine/threonine-protein kinase
MRCTRRRALQTTAGAVAGTLLPAGKVCAEPVSSLRRVEVGIWVEEKNAVQVEERELRFVTLPLSDATRLEMVRIPAGKFLMGSAAAKNEGPVREVHVPEFYMGVSEVTVGQWATVRNYRKHRIELRNPLRMDRTAEEQWDFPVDLIPYAQAVEFCERVSERFALRCRLPAEAEWEYGCRAGSEGNYWYGEEASLAYSNFNAGQRPLGAAAVTREVLANGFGLKDMHGNVAEWCLDVWNPDYEGAPTDGSARPAGGNTGLRVHRGGMYLLNGNVMRSSARFSWYADFTISGLGMRLCMERPAWLVDEGGGEDRAAGSVRDAAIGAGLE